MKLQFLALAAAAFVAMGCSASPSNNISDDELSQDNPQNGPACTAGREYDGFGGEKVDLGRVDGSAAANHTRIKPTSALKSEYTRVLGAAPDSLAKQSDSIGKAEPRYYAEPQAGAVALYSLYSVAFDGCASTLTSGPFSAAPTLESAKTQCHALGRKFWSRTLTDDEATACAQLAVQDLPANEAPARRWAHMCAALLTSAGFLSY